MENSILTPLQLWQNHNASATPLQYSIVNKYFSGEICLMDIYFTAYVGEKSRDRVYVKVAFPSGGKNLPSILYVPDFEQILSDETLISYASKGYAVFCVDYTGKLEGKERYTVYSDEHFYGNYPKAGAHLTVAEPSVKETCAYLWSVVARRTLTLMRRLYMVDRENISIVGVKGGAMMMWHVAGFDDRIKSAIAINNAGRQWDADDTAKERTPAEQRWLMGCAVQSYAKFIKCPFLYVGSSNSPVTSAQKVWNTLRLLPQSSVTRRCISTGLQEQLEKETKITVFHWLEATLKKTVPLRENPELDIYEREGKFFLKLSNIKAEEVSEMVVSYTTDKEDNVLRNWRRFTLSEFESEIPIYENEEQIAVFVSVYYTDGSTFSTRLRTAEFTEKMVKLPVKKSRILYDRKMGVFPFYAESGDDFFTKRKSVFLKNGPLEIPGLTTESDNLFTYQIAEERFRGDEERLLQFDVYCENPREVEVQLWVCEDGEIDVFTAVFELEKAEWAKVSFEAQDFKNHNMQSLKNWSKVKKLQFVSAKGLLFNNFLWV